MLKYYLLITGLGSSMAFSQSTPAKLSSHERVRVIHQDISKWDKNKDGRLTGSERDVFLADKRKERIASETAAQAAKPKPPKRIQRIPPPMRPEDAHRPAPKGIPKKIEDAQRAGH